MTAIWMHRGTSEFDAVERFISAKIWGKPKVIPGDTIIAAADKAGNALGAAIYQNYYPDTGVIEMSAASVSPRWLTRPFLREMFGYPFNQLGCQAVVLRCDVDNTRLDRILKAYGFTRHDVPRLRGRNRDEAIYVLAEEVWRANGFHKETANG